MREDLLDLVDHTGRVNYRLLVRYAHKRSKVGFVDDARHPFLLGKELYEGILEQDRLRRGNTMPFKARLFREQLQAELEGSKTGSLRRVSRTPAGIDHAVFLLRKRRDTPGLPNEITVGRLSDSDLVIVDYAVSKTHAKILLLGTEYGVVDLGSTNGTLINEERIHPGSPVQLPVNADIAFGRMVFHFVSPDMLHDLLVGANPIGVGDG